MATVKLQLAAVSSQSAGLSSSTPRSAQMPTCCSCTWQRRRHAAAVSCCRSIVAWSMALPFPRKSRIACVTANSTAQREHVAATGASCTECATGKNTSAKCCDRSVCSARTRFCRHTGWATVWLYRGLM